MILKKVTDYGHHDLSLYHQQDVAERVAREAQLLLYSPVTMPMDSYPIQQLPEEQFVVFITATTGQVCQGRSFLYSTHTAASTPQHAHHPVVVVCSQGDPPDNMRRFWKLLLRKSLPPTILSGTNYAVFGLGDSGYVKYNVSTSTWVSTALRPATFCTLQQPAEYSPSCL